MNITEEILNKAALLRKLLAKADLDINFSTKVAWGENKEEKYIELLTLTANTLELFGTNKINLLDYSERMVAINNYNTALDNALAIFPLEREQTQSNNR